jgi:hypothetical protein
LFAAGGFVKVLRVGIALNFSNDGANIGSDIKRYLPFVNACRPNS